MPFTASHIAAVLPLARAPLVASALVIGSMSPDIPYYLPLWVDGQATHSLVGIVTIDVLLGLGVFVLWHGFLARPALSSAPPALRGRIPAQARQGLRVRLSPPSRLILVLASLSVGAATHVLWDAFTHDGRWGTDHIPWLAAHHGALAGYRLAQYASGLVGALVVGLWMARWWRRTTVVPPEPGLGQAVAASAWVAVFVAGATGVVLGSIPALTSATDPDLRSAAILGANRGGALATLMALLLAASWHLVTVRRRSASPPAAQPCAGHASRLPVTKAAGEEGCR